MVDAPSSHPSSEQIRSFALGKLGDAAAVQVADHLAECPPCQEAVASVPDDSVLRLVRSAPPSSVSGTAETLLTGAATDSWVPPELIGHSRYRLLEWLGAGGMGVVFKAQHRLMDRTVAIKVISKKLTTNPAAVERFEREVRAAARLSHPNIVAAFDAERAGDLHFLVMEFVEGTNLARLVEEKGRLPVDLACDYARQAASGLQHAFEQGMVHRDIKPSNLMVTDKGVVKILDFGVAGFTGEVGEGEAGYTGTLGTPSYMAPEQMRDLRSADIRSDIYSLGCTLYFLLAGQTPFPHGTTQQKLSVPNEAIPRLLKQLQANLPVGLLQVLEKMLAQEPAQRYPTPAALAEVLVPFGTSGSFQNRRKHLLGLGIVGILALGAPLLYKAATVVQGVGDQTQPATTNPPAEADTEAVPLDAATFRFKEFDWERGKPVVPMIPNDKGFCVLTGISGKLHGAGEWITVRVGKEGRWLLEGNSSQPRTPISVLHGSATAIETPQRDFFELEVKEYEWNAWSPPIKMLSQQDGVCFLSSVRGGFLGGGEEVGVSVHDDGYWYLRGRCITAVSARALALRAKRPGTFHARIREHTWVAGGKPIKMIAQSEGFCFLSGIEGAFHGGKAGGYNGGEWVRVNLKDGIWYLTGGSLQSSVKAKAISVALR